MRPHVVVVDNYDSFTHNVVAALELAGARTEVVLHDVGDAEALIARGADGYVIAAGPCTPERAGASLTLVASLGERRPRTPLLGLCLGHQVIACHAGARLRRATEPMHGKLARVRHDGRGVLTGLASPLPVARYNSLVVDAGSLPDTIEPTGWDEHGDIMALRHRTLPHEGIQFHPESWLCPDAAAIFDNWVRRLSESA